MSKHYYDKLGICLKCDLCDLDTCCEQSINCSGSNWNFIYHMDEIVKKIRERRKL